MRAAGPAPTRAGCAAAQSRWQPPRSRAPHGPPRWPLAHRPAPARGTGGAHSRPGGPVSEECVGASWQKLLAAPGPPVMAAAAGTKANRDTRNPGVQAPSRWRYPQGRVGEAREEHGYGRPSPHGRSPGAGTVAMAALWQEIASTVAAEFSDVPEAAQATRIVVRRAMAA